MVEKLSGLMGQVSSKALGDLTQVRLCSGRPQKCTVHSVHNTEEVFREYLAKLVENKKVTATIGNAINFEGSVQVSKEFYQGFLSLLKAI